MTRRAFIARRITLPPPMLPTIASHCAKAMQPIAPNRLSVSSLAAVVVYRPACVPVGLAADATPLASNPLDMTFLLDD